MLERTHHVSPLHRKKSGDTCMWCLFKHKTEVIVSHSEWEFFFLSDRHFWRQGFSVRPHVGPLCSTQTIYSLKDVQSNGQRHSLLEWSQFHRPQMRFWNPRVPERTFLETCCSSEKHEAMWTPRDNAQRHSGLGSTSLETTAVLLSGRRVEYKCRFREKIGSKQFQKEKHLEEWC